MQRTEVLIDDSAFAQALAYTAPAVQGLRATAEAIAAQARSRAPVRSGDYRDGIGVQYDASRAYPRCDVVATDWKSAILENEHRTLGTAADTTR